MRNWLCKLGYVYKNIQKDMFMDKYKRSDIVEYHINFLIKMEELKPYMVEFDKDGTMKPKTYPLDCVVKGENKWPIIMITHNKCTFSTNGSVKKVWT